MRGGNAGAGARGRERGTKCGRGPGGRSRRQNPPPKAWGIFWGAGLGRSTGPGYAARNTGPERETGAHRPEHGTGVRAGVRRPERGAGGEGGGARAEQQVLDSMIVAAENDKLIFYVWDYENATEDAPVEDIFALKNKETGYIWWSSPFNAGGDPNATPTLRKELASALTIEDGDPKSRSTS